MRRKGYRAYRGRSSGRYALKIAAVLVIVLAVLAAAAAVYMQQYLVVTPDGVRLELPFSRQEEPDSGTEESPAVSDLPLVVVTPEPTGAPADEPEPLPVSPVSLPREALYDGSAAAQAAAAGGDCALFDMKDDEGTLAFTSAALTKYSGHSSAGGDNEAIRSMNAAEGLYTIARVSCFRDDYIFFYSSSYPLYANSGDRWIDSDRLHWLSPNCYDVRAYLTAVCVELAELGFDEILLDNAGYPTQGSLQYLRKGEDYDSARFGEIVDGFYAQTAAALSQYDVTLSVVTTREALDGTDTLSGQTPENLSRCTRFFAADGTGEYVLIPVDSSPS